MDRPRRIAGEVWVAVGVLAMAGWTLTEPAHPAGFITWAAAILVALGTAAQAVTGSLRWWGGRLCGGVVGLELVGAVGDRFGAFGRPGSPAVSWGDWSHFQAEAAQLVPWDRLVVPAAVAATVAEVVLGVLLVVGPWQRWTGKATAGLFVIYLLAMIPGMGSASILEYGLPVLIGGALVSSARGDRRATHQSPAVGRENTLAADYK
ncbi:MauE/DoxX family redox-associated membrane protein [Actinopolymorpha rutila]|uniref:Methylamine utilisation protein MauE domain-containing protein n=1 Tax=Actinopolymorpha rutila TaxID=446787 RepID=A0A852ZN76_9ACTN|nr:MauE/DoxX family redox-associated membrane protein [Actinopolymorpha rutila]NYH93348.1 hypothetical protein [Actinopolymorpha rutila]